MKLPTLDIEKATIAIGLPAILAAKPRWGIGVAEEGARIQRDIKRAVGGFLASPTPTKCAPLPPFDYEEVRDTLDTLQQKAPEVTEALMVQLDDPELAHGVAMQATRICQVVAALLPRNIRQEITGDTPDLPAPSRVSGFARCWAVACDPRIVLADLREHSVVASQVMDFAQFYPALYAYTQGCVMDGLVAIKSKRATWNLDGPRDRLVRVLMGTGPRDADIAGDMQALYASPAAKAPASSSGSNINLTGGDQNAPGLRESPTRGP